MFFLVKKYDTINSVIATFCINYIYCIIFKYYNFMFCYPF